MANGFAVAQSIGRLGSRIRDIAKEDTRRQEDFAKLGLEQTRLDLMGLQKQREGGLAVAKLQREKELDTPTAMGDLITILPANRQAQVSEFLTKTVDPATDQPFAASISTPRKFVDSFTKINELIRKRQAETAKTKAATAEKKEERVFTEKQNKAKIKSNEKINTAKISSAEKIAGAKNSAQINKAKRALRTEATKQWTELQASLVEPETNPDTGKPFTRREFISAFVADVEGIVGEKKTTDLDETTARQFLQQAKGDKDVARQLAQEAGFLF